MWDTTTIDAGKVLQSSHRPDRDLPAKGEPQAAPAGQDRGGLARGVELPFQPDGLSGFPTTTATPTPAATSRMTSTSPSSRVGVLGPWHRPSAAPASAASGRQHAHARSAVPVRTPPGPSPTPGRRPAAADIRPHTGRARLGYDRARVLPDTYAGLDLHQLRHSAATHLAAITPNAFIRTTPADALRSLSWVLGLFSQVRAR
ncbi:hypothetical protein [Nonomuraea candida]|uniref:hypothetical protein n=1 Tax=Nonomuraea candida TaxID=359159 RepID=UPI000AE97442|nr:hypothetical protein [Nonomuraea candida]